MFIIVTIILVVVFMFIIYRYFAMQKDYERDVKLKMARVEKIQKKLIDNELIGEAEIYPYAKDAKTRVSIYELLKQHNLTDLFPKSFLTREKFAESYLVNWLEFPTELGKSPDEIEQVEIIEIDDTDTKFYYYVFKFRTHPPHWAADEDWLLGVVGPYLENSNPTDFPNGTFSRLSSQFGKTSPQEEAEWVHQNITRTM